MMRTGFARLFLGGLLLSCGSDPVPMDDEGSAASGSGTSNGSTSSQDEPSGTAGTSGIGTSSNGTPESERIDPELAAEPADVVLMPAGGTFRETLEVQLVSEREGAEIRYTTDGSLPTADSALYDGSSVSLSATTQLRVQTFVDGAAVGQGATGIYVQRDFDFSGELPVMVLDSYGTGPLDIQSREFETAGCLLFGSASGADLQAEPTLVTRCGFHVRGQSSATFAKTPYRIEFWDEEDDDRDLSPLGMPAESDWALLGPDADESLIRHPFAFELGRDMGLEAPRSQFVEFYLNLDGGAVSADDYMGVYLLTETIKNAKNRTDLKQLREGDTSPEQLSGGYIFKFEFMAAEEPTLPCTGDPASCWSDLEVYDPSPLEPEQGDWLQEYVQGFHDALRGDNPADPANGYPAFIHVDSFVDMFLLSEFTKNADAYVRSAYFHKDRDQKIVAGPLWDYNLSMGAGFSLFGIDNLSTEGWMYPQRTEGTSDWFPRLIADPDFLARVRARWTELRSGMLSDEQVSARIDELSAPLVAAAARNFERWGGPGSAGGGDEPAPGMVGPGGGDLSDVFTGPDAPTYEGQLQAMKDWAAARAAWLDGELLE